MCVRYQGATSEFQSTPGGGPQGSLLIVLFFILIVNDAGKPCTPKSTLPEDVHGPEPNPFPTLDTSPHPTQAAGDAPHDQSLGGSSISTAAPPPCHSPTKTARFKYVDDLTLLEEVSLGSLERIPKFIGPFNYHERHGLYLPKEASVLQHSLSDLSSFTAKNLMKINLKKTQVMPFNFSKTKDFIPQLSIKDDYQLDVIYKTKLLGLVITSDLSWSEHIQYIVSKASQNFWMLIRFKRLGATPDKLLTIYLLKIRSLLEYASPVFHSSLTTEQSNMLESTQKKALAIIYGKDYKSYDTALKLAKIERLDVRRKELSLNFAKKCVKNQRHSMMFPRAQNTRTSSRNPRPFIELRCNTTRFFKSAIPAMTRLLNKNALSVK